jgi:hypothetical protein
MNTISTKLLFASAAAVALVGSAAAQARDNTINNNQRNWAQARAQLNATIESVTEDVSLTSAAIGNSFSTSLGGPSVVRTTQNNTAPVTADLTVNVEDALGSLTATAAAIGNSASVEIDATAGIRPASNGSIVNNNQWFNNTEGAVARLAITGGNISSGNPELGVEATAAAIANSLTVDVTGGSLVSDNLQRFWGDARSNLAVDLNDVTGDSNLASAAIANSASYNVEDATAVDINNRQWAYYDPTAVSNINLNDVTGDITSTTAAISNTLSVTTLPSQSTLTVTSDQQNGASNFATANLDIGAVIGNVTATAAAIGNSVSITNLPTD